MILALLVFGRIDGVTTCPTAGLTGLPCPGCGLTRAAIAGMQGRYPAAFALHPLVFAVVPAVTLYLAAYLVDAIRPQRWLHTRGVERFISVAGIVLAVALCAVWVARFAGYFGGPVATDPWFW